jgi:hypothetical protein
VIRFILTSSCLALCLAAFPQGGCLDFNQRVFAVQLIFDDGQEPRNAPKLFLVNERGEHYWYEPEWIFEDPAVRKTPMELKLNTAKNARPGKNPYTRHDHWTALPENLNACAIPVQTKETKHKPLYQVLVVWETGNQTDSLLVTLPYEKSLNPCSNYLREPGRAAISFDDGSAFTPIAIYPDQHLPKKEINPPLNQITLIPSYSTLRNKAGKDSVIAVTGVDVVQTQTLAPVQRITFSATKYVPLNLQGDLFETGDFLSDNAPGIADFRIARKDDSDPVNQINRKYYDHYAWQPEVNQYALQPKLSEKPNVSWQREPGKLHAFEINLSETEKTVIDYVFTPSGWTQVNSTSYRTQPEAVKQSPPPPDCVKWRSLSMRMPKVLEASDNLVRFIYQDSLLFDYFCSAREAFEISPSQIQNLFSLRTSVKEKSGALTLSEYVTVQPGSIQLIERNTYIKYPGGKQEMIGFFRFVVAPDTRITNAQGEVTGYQSKSYDNGLTAWTIELGTSGTPVGYGLIELQGRQKVGTWQRWNEQGERMNPEYHRQKVSLTIENPERMNASFKVSAREAGKWTTIPHTLVPEQYSSGERTVQFFMDKRTDSLRISCGEYRATHRITHPSYQAEAYLSLYLIGKNEDYIDMGVRMPIVWDQSAYVMTWDIEWLMTKYSNSGINAGQEQIMANLRAQYPDMIISPFSEQCRCVELSFPKSSSSRRKQLIDAMLKEPYVKQLSQILQTSKGFRTFLSDYVYIQTDVNLRNEQILAIGKKYGLNLSNIFGSGNGWSAYAGDRLIDRAWLLDKQRIINEPGVLTTSYSWFSEISLD